MLRFTPILGRYDDVRLLDYFEQFNSKTIYPIREHCVPPTLRRLHIMIAYRNINHFVTALTKTIAGNILQTSGTQQYHLCHHTWTHRKRPKCPAFRLIWLVSVNIYIFICVAWLSSLQHIFTTIVLQIRANQSIGVCGLNAPSHVAAGYRAEKNSAKVNFVSVRKSVAIRSSVMVSIMLYLLLFYVKCLYNFIRGILHVASCHSCQV